MYLQPFGHSTRCYTNTGDSYEADEPTTSGDGFYNEGTFARGFFQDDPKLDYTFFNWQRFFHNYGGDATSSHVSDHDLLRSAMTVHD